LRTIACWRGGRSSEAGGDVSPAASVATADRRSEGAPAGISRATIAQNGRDRSRTSTATLSTGDATVAANAGQSTSKLRSAARMPPGAPLVAANGCITVETRPRPPRSR
jgi:hypothetical protein